MQKKFFSQFFLWLTLLLCSCSLQAEIEQVTVYWTAGLCPYKQCGKLIYNTLKQLPGVEHTTIDFTTGKAELRWKPGVRFTYEEFDFAFRMIGLSIRDIWVIVSGRLGVSNEDFFLISHGDRTRFDLLNPTIPSTTRQEALYNREARVLAPYLQKKLLKGEEEGRMITIEGVLFMPWRHYTHAQLVVNRVTFSDQENLPNR